MTKHASFDLTEYVSVELRHRSDGWIPARQIDFLLALSESSCVTEACRAVGMSVASAYALRRRIDGTSFRSAWDAALDYGVGWLRDAAQSRAVNGVARPVFYKGEQIGERRYYDERLTMFILRLRDPARFGSWRDRTSFAPEADTRAELAENLIYDTEAQAELQFSRDDLYSLGGEAPDEVEISGPEADSGPKPDSDGDVSSTSSTSE